MRCPVCGEKMKVDKTIDSGNIPLTLRHYFCKYGHEIVTKEVMVDVIDPITVLGTLNEGMEKTRTTSSKDVGNQEDSIEWWEQQSDQI